MIRPLVSAQIAKMGAKEVGPGAIIFRYGDKLYMVHAATDTLNDLGIWSSTFHP